MQSSQRFTLSLRYHVRTHELTHTLLRRPIYSFVENKN